MSWSIVQMAVLFWYYIFTVIFPILGRNLQNFFLVILPFSYTFTDTNTSGTSVLYLSPEKTAESQEDAPHPLIGCKSSRVERHASKLRYDDLLAAQQTHCFSMHRGSTYTKGIDPGRLGVLTIPEICRRGQSMFFDPSP